MSAGMLEDQRIREANKRVGHKLCQRCEGTGNELYAMKRTCRECGGSGVAERFGEHPALIRKLVLRRERNMRRRLSRAPRDWKVEARWLLSYVLGVGHWFHDRRDRCRHCDAMPSDIDFEMRRVGPFRAECWDVEACRESVAESQPPASTEGERR